MRERPILFSAPMVRAILDDRKTQTRRVVKPQPVLDLDSDDCLKVGLPETRALGYYSGSTPFRWSAHDCAPVETPCPYGQPGDRLWVRETWSHTGTGVWSIDSARLASDGSLIYRADGDRPGCKWWPSIHMPREFSRITLEVTGVRVERLQAISEDDARAEGVERHLDGWFPYGIETCLTTFVGGKEQPAQFATKAAASFQMLWESINGAGSWSANPWVWVVAFKRVVQ